MVRPPHPSLLVALRLAVGIGAAMVSVAGVAQPSPSIGFDVPTPGTLSTPGSMIYQIAQDRSGYLWIASEEGLHRYDGVAFDAFRVDPDDPASMPGNRVTDVAIALDGAVWAAVDRYGLVRFSQATGRLDRFRLPDGLNRDLRIAVDGDGMVWISSAAPVAAGVAVAGRRVRFDPVRRRVVVTPQPADVQRVHTDALGRLWVLRPDGAYRKRKTTGWIRYPFSDPVWVSGPTAHVISAGRLYRHEPRSDGFVAVADPARLVGTVLSPSTSPPLVDRSGLLWGVDADDNLLAADLATGTANRYRPDPLRPDALPPGRLSTLFEGDDGVLWIGTPGGVRTLGPGWLTFRSERLAATPYISYLAAGRAGRLWGGNACEEPWGIAASGSGERVPLSSLAPAVARGLALAAADGFCASDLTEGDDGSFWVSGWPFGGARGGVLHIHADGQTTGYDVPSASTVQAARHVHLDRAGRAWAATETALVRLDSNGVTRRYEAEPGNPRALPTGTIWVVADAPGGDLWVGTYGGGLAQFDPDRGDVARRFTNDPLDERSLSSGIVTALLPDPSEAHILWVGTYDGGLNRLDLRSGQARRFTRRDGLPDLTVKSLLADAAGDLWVATGKGLVWLDRQTGETRTYSEADGLPGVTFGLYDGVARANGHLAYLVDGHLVTFDPAEVRPTQLAAPVVLRGVRVDGQRRTVPPPGDAVVLSPSERALGVELAALAFVAPTGLRYAVRLEGVDDWTDLGTDRSASWGQLAPGKYTLRARVGTSSGSWSPRELAVPIVVLPTWWERGAVRGGALLLALLTFVVAIREVSQRRLRRTVRALEVEHEAAQRLHAERERISRDLHDHVGAQLTSLLAGVDLARLSRGQGDGAPATAELDPLDAIEEDARTTIRQLRETIWALHHEEIPVDAFCDRLRSDAARLVRGRTRPVVSVDCGTCGETVLSSTQALHLYRIAQEALSNVVKHAGASRVDVTVRCEAGRVRVEVADDGTFAGQASRAGRGMSGPTGFGLASMQARATALGATFHLDTTHGTRIVVEAPLDAAGV